MPAVLHVLVAFVASVLASPLLSSTSTPLESLASVPDDWSYVAEAPREARLALHVALIKPDHDADSQLERVLLDISSPGSGSYGAFLSHRQLQDLVSPGETATNAVRDWLHSGSAEDVQVTGAGDMMKFTATVEQLEVLFDTKFGIYRYLDSSHTAIRTLSYSVPNSLRQYIQMIQPTTRFGRPRPHNTNVFEIERTGLRPDEDSIAAAQGLGAGETCNNTVTPACLRDLYKLPPAEVLAKALPDNTSIGFAAFNNFLEEYPRYADLDSFVGTYAPFAKGSNFSWTSVNGGLLDQNSTDDSVEANLDAQYILTTGYPVPILAYSTAGRGPLVPDLTQPDANDSSNEPYLEFLTYLIAQPDKELPHTLSTSYGENEQSLPYEYRDRVCKLFGQLGARGVSILFSSGDSGPGTGCQTNDGKNTTRFQPEFPTSCPWVTAVGGTAGIKPERAVDFSSGGFSEQFSRPQWQNDAVQKYLNTASDAKRWKGLYNPKGRAIPDVAAQGYRFKVVDKGQTIYVGGTSASAPTFAGVVALLNAERLAAGRKPLGFLNPWLYSTGIGGLVDIVDGKSSGCESTDSYSGLPAPEVKGAGWNATKGWDPVTGLGTPDATKLLALALKK